ncbi:hypothetical protein NU688_33520 [Variovorax sp. ZS18.2.2]|uniref:hypothetical protein n=1 Tax=Variovorax sp. ZS18.2.2 TaxID=2971255 RepID=UPI002150A671|nr:hypothetical protein [Variovorax sp. ZS18.2.2]MCR6481119.1 hypothetical protein [Variovorax sp. ZS18.2.2]
MNLDRMATAVLLVIAAAALAACDKTPSAPAAKAGSSSASTQPLPAVFDTAARVISAQGYKLAECVAIADDKEKLACYAALGFKGPSDVADIEALSGMMDVMAGKRWQITAPSAGNASSFQGGAYLTFAGLKNEGPMAFRNTRIRLQCPATWGSSSNQKWAASVEVPFEAGYDPKGKERGTMVVEVDGKTFDARQFSRTSFNIAADNAVAFRDALIAGKSVAFSVSTIDGRTGSVKASLPEGGDSLKAYFDKFCP